MLLAISAFSMIGPRLTVLAEARRSLLTATSTENDADLAEAFSQVLSIADESGLETLISDIVANRPGVDVVKGVDMLVFIHLLRRNLALR